MRSPNRLHTLYAELKRIHMTYRPDWRLGQFMSNIILLLGDTFYIEDNEFIERIKNLFKEKENETMFKVGQWVYTIEVIDEEYESAEVTGYLFMAECNDYIICCSEYSHCADDFNAQLEEMCQETAENYGSLPDVGMFRKELCFETKEQAEAELARRIEDSDLY